MPYYENGQLKTDIREVAISTTWDSQTDWEAYQSATNIEVVNGVVQLAETSIPSSTVLQYDISQENGYSDGDAISTLTDWVGDADATGSATYLDNALNGMPVANFDGVDDGFVNGTFSQAQSYAKLVVGVYDTVEGTYFTDSDSFSNRSVIGRSYTEAMGIYAGSWVRSGSVPTSYSIVGGVFNGTSSEYRVNGSVVASGDAGSQSHEGITIGQDYSGGANTNGKIAEVIVISDITEIGEAETYLSDKWGIAI